MKNQVELLLSRIANRSENPDDAKTAALELRDLARSIQWNGKLLSSTNPPTLDEAFAAHLATK